MEVHKINSIGQGMEIDNMRKTKLVAILKKEEKNSEDLKFIDLYITTYMPEVGKMLKSKFQKEAYEKIYEHFTYKKKSVDDVVFDQENYDHHICLVLSGKLSLNGIKKNEEDGSIANKDSLESYNKNTLINPENLKDKLKSGKYDLYNCTCVEESEIVSIEVSFYERIVKEYEDQAKNEKIKTLSKVFSRFKKVSLDRASKEELLTNFREEKFSKGTVVISSKSKVEEIYTIQQGRVALVQKNDFNPNYSKAYVIFGILDKDCAFNEYPLVLERESPYTVVCTEDVKVLVLDKNNFGTVCDNDTTTDLRANAACKERLQRLYLERFKNFSKEDAENSQKRFLKTLGVEYKDVEAIFNKSNPKSNQYLKNVEKFNALVGKPTTAQTTDPKAKFSEFATPRLVSKDPKFAALDPQRQLSLMALRNEGAMRRSGNTATTTSSILKNPEQLRSVQKALLNEEKLEKLVTKKEISETKSLKVEEESKSSANNPLNKFKRNNDDLLAKFGVAKTEGEGSGDSQPTEEPKKNADTEENHIKFDKKVEEGDQFGLAMAKKNLMVRPLGDGVLKKKSNLLSNPGML